MFKKAIFKCAAAMLMWAWGGAVLAAGNDPEAATALGKLLARVQSFQAQFEQTVRGARNAKGEVTRGVFQLQRPGRFRWETRKPYAQLLVSTGKELWSFEPDIDSATVQDLDQGLGATPALLLSSSADELTRSFNIRRRDDQAFVLTPKDGAGNFEEVMLQFSGDVLSALQLADSLGNLTTVMLSAVELNGAIAASQFEFKPGKNVDVIDNRSKARK